MTKYYFLPTHADGDVHPTIDVGHESDNVRDYRTVAAQDAYLASDYRNALIRLAATASVLVEAWLSDARDGMAITMIDRAIDDTASVIQDAMQLLKDES